MGGPAPTELRLEFRDLTTNMGLRNGFSNTLRWSPMPGAALSTTLLDPLQRPGACNRTSTIEKTRPSLCAKVAGPRRQSSASKANASIHVAPARFKNPATTIGRKNSTTEQLRRSSRAKDAGPRHQRNVNRRSRVRRVAKALGLSSDTLASERKGKFSHVRSVRIKKP